MDDERQRDSDAEPAAPSANETGTPSEPAHAPQVERARETRALLDGIDISTLTGLRDRALLGVLVYSFARVSAAVSLRVADYYTQGRRSFFRLHEKGGRYNVVPAHHTAQAYVDAYLEAAGIGEDRRGPLFRSCEPGRPRCAPRPGNVALERAEDDQAPRPKGEPPRRDLRPQLPRHRDHRVPAKWRGPRGRGPDRGARVDPHHSALQPAARRDLARRDRAHPHLSAAAPGVLCSGGSCPRIAKQGTRARPRLVRE